MFRGFVYLIYDAEYRTKLPFKNIISMLSCFRHRSKCIQSDKSSLWSGGWSQNILIVSTSNEPHESYIQRLCCIAVITFLILSLVLFFSRIQFLRLVWYVWHKIDYISLKFFISEVDFFPRKNVILESFCSLIKRLVHRQLRYSCLENVFQIILKERISNQIRMTWFCFILVFAVWSSIQTAAGEEVWHFINLKKIFST